MLKSQRLAVLPIEPSSFASDLDLIDNTEAANEYGAFTFGSWKSYVLANPSGDDADTAFRPEVGGLALTDLGRRLPGIMRIVERHFNREKLQWVRVFALQDGILAPHVDFLEFDKPGVRLQVPLRTSTESLHSENETVYHLRRGEVWQIHTTDPHSARSAQAPSRLSLCLDFDGETFDPTGDIYDAIEADTEVYIAQRPELPEEELKQMIDTAAARITPDTLREEFWPFAEAHYQYRSPATDIFDWFATAASRSAHPELADRAVDFKRYCLSERAFQEEFSW